jgi:DNA-binding response OmpR family regulator
VLERERDARFEVVEAATGAECLKAADTQGPFDLILMDVGLPDIDGFSLCRALRRVERDVPIVFITAKNELRDYAEGRQAGADSYLVKPISRTALRSAIALFTSIDRRRSSSEPTKK